ncbi:MAG: hypothetical protein QG597_2839, partial [Actinomycetota bacterium]|nr:hypothetical protein [Actinomycetota bacterium]
MTRITGSHLLAMVVAVIVCLGLVVPQARAAAPPTPGTGIEVGAAVVHDTSRPLRELPVRPAARDGAAPENRPAPEARLQAQGGSAAKAPTGPTSQVDAPSSGPMPATIENFAGMTQPNGYYPPDTNGDVGPREYVQIVNTSFAVYAKDGTLLYGPVNNNTLWGGFGGECQNQNDGDPIVQYDQLADRWLISQFAVNGADNYECVAVSATGDPLGAYHRYAFN